MTSPTLDQILHILEVNKSNPHKGVCAALVVLALKADMLEATIR